MSANRIKKQIAERTLDLKNKSAEVQKMLHVESKRLAKLDEQLKIVKDDTHKEETRQLQMAERGQGKTSAVREAEMFRQKKCSQLEVRLSRTRQMMSRTEDENQQIRAKIDELRRLIMMQTDVYSSNEARMHKIKEEQTAHLLHSDYVLYEKDIICKKIEEITEKNGLEIEDTEHLLTELHTYIEKEAKASKEFYERQMKETPTFDDSFKENMVAEIRQRALTYAEEKKTEVEIEEELAHIKDAFARLRDEAIGDQSFDEALKQFIAVESECIKIMSYIRAKEVEVEVEEEMAAKFAQDSEAHAAANGVLQKKLDEVEVLRKERDAVQEEEDRLKREHGKLKQQMARWASALNSVFKAMSVDLEQLGVYGGRVTADADLVMLMGVVEAKTQRVLTSFNKFVAAGGLKKSLSLASALEKSAAHVSGDLSEPGSPGERGDLPASPGSASMGGLSLPNISGRSFGGGNAHGSTSFGIVASDDEEDEEGDSDDEDAFIKPMSSIELKRSLQNSLTIGRTSPGRSVQ